MEQGQTFSNIWIGAFCAIYSSKEELEARLTELETWDKPRQGKEGEHAKKVEALKYLISELEKQ